MGNWAEGDEEEEEEGERHERGKSTDEESTEWNAVSKWSDEGERYHGEEEVGEAEELFSSTISSTEKLEEERRRIEDSVLAEIPAEVGINLSFGSRSLRGVAVPHDLRDTLRF